MQPFAVYKKSDLTIVGYSGITSWDGHTWEWETETNVIPVHGGTLDDYAFVEITEEQEFLRRERQHLIQLVNGVPTFVILPEDLGAYKTQKIAELDELCRHAVFAGFVSNALGTPHTYSFDFEAQIKFVGIRPDLDDPNFPGMDWGTKEAGPVFHTREQLSQLYQDGREHLLDKQRKFWDYRDNHIKPATSKEEIDAIMAAVTW